MSRLLIAWLAVCVVVFAAAYFETQHPGLIIITGGFYAGLLWLVFADRCEARTRG